MLPKNVTHFAKIVYMGLTPPPFSPLFKNCNIIVRGHPRVFISILLKIDALCDRSDMWHCNVAARGVAGTLEGTAAEAARCEWKPLPALSPPLAPRQWRDSVPAAKMPPKVWAASFTAFVEIFNFQLSPSLLNAINCIFQSLQFAADLCFPTNLSASLSLSRFISKWRLAAQDKYSP